MSETVETSKPVELTAEQKSNAPLDAAIAKQKEIADKVAARAAELKTNVGKWFVPKVTNPRFPDYAVKIVEYQGVKLTQGGNAHIFFAESINPRASWCPSATTFLEEHEPCDAPVEQSNPLPA